MKTTLSFALSLCLAGAAAAAFPSLSQARPLQPDDIYQAVDVSDPQVSPDGNWVAYLVTRSDRDADEARASIWMVSWDGSQKLALTGASESVHKPRWSPDGRFLAYIANPAGSDKAQIMVLDRRGGEGRQVTRENGDIDDFSWSPDSRRIAFVRDEADPPKPMPMVIEALHFKQDGDGYLTTARLHHIYVVDVDSGKADALTQGADSNDELPAWSPDGKLLAFTHTRERGTDPDGREDIDLIEPSAGAKAHTLARVFASNSQRLTFTPDGSQLAFFEGLEPKHNAYMQDHLFLVPVSGGAPRAVGDKLDRAVTSYAFSDDSSAAQVLIEDDVGAYAGRLDLKSGTLTRETAPGPYTVSSLSSAKGHSVVLETSDAEPGEVHALEHGKLRKLTDHNDAWLKDIRLGAVDELNFKNKEGTEIHGLLVKPPDFVAGRKYPLVLWIHGGPNGGDQHLLNLDGYEFEHQMFAAKGYLVLRVNYRGGSGRGLAYAKAIEADWGHKEVIDLLAGVDSLVARGLADPDRLAIGGWSYGGILTDYTIATDRRFKVAISGAGSANQLSMYGVDEYVLQYNNELGPPWRDTALWMKVSYPFFHADRIHTPTLFLGGERDFNVPVVGGEQMYEALRTLGVPTQLVIYPGQHHVFSRPSFVKDLADRMSAWLDRFIPSTAPK